MRVWMILMTLGLTGAAAWGAKEDFVLLPQPGSVSWAEGAGLDARNLRAVWLVGLERRPVLPAELDRLPLVESIDKPGVVKLQLTKDGTPENDEGYTLTIENGNATIAARAEAGVFYGCQTLAQLLQDSRDLNEPIPAVKIVDEPAVPYRAVHIDTKHALDRMEYYYAAIDRLASYKINAVIWEVEDKLGYRRQPAVAAPDAFSIEEMAALTRYARERHIEISPLVQGLGHASFILKHDEYKDLRDDPNSDWAFDPMNPRTYEVQFDLYRDAIDATPGSRYLHVGGDEVNVGKSARDKASGKTPLELHLYWLGKVAEFCKEHGRIPIMWDDMPLKYAGVYGSTHQGNIGEQQAEKIWKENGENLDKYVGMIPKNCVFMRWNYSACEAPGNVMALQWYADHGIKAMTATSAQTTWLLHPRNGGNVRQIRAFDRLTASHHLAGSLCTAWGDSSPPFETFWRGFIAHAEYCWSPEGRSIEEFNKAYVRREFGTDAAAGLEDQLIDALNFWDSALLASGGRHDMYDPNPDQHLVPMPNAELPGRWSKRYAKKIDQAKTVAAGYAAGRAKFEHAIALARRNRYGLRLREAMYALPEASARMILATAACDTEPKSASARNELRQALADYEAAREAFFHVFAETRFLDMPANYLLDPHGHMANYDRNHRWMVCVEDRFAEQAANWLQGNLPAERMIQAFGTGDRDGWKILGASSEETVKEDGRAAHAIDGDPGTI